MGFFGKCKGPPPKPKVRSTRVQKDFCCETVSGCRVTFDVLNGVLSSQVKVAYGTHTDPHYGVQVEDYIYINSDPDAIQEVIDALTAVKDHLITHWHGRKYDV
jgi:hypothetical protein